MPCTGLRHFSFCDLAAYWGFLDNVTFLSNVFSHGCLIWVHGAQFLCSQFDTPFHVWLMHAFSTLCFLIPNGNRRAILTPCLVLPHTRVIKQWCSRRLLHYYWNTLGVVSSCLLHLHHGKHNYFYFTLSLPLEECSEVLAFVCTPDLITCYLPHCSSDDWMNQSPSQECVARDIQR